MLCMLNLRRGTSKPIKKLDYQVKETKFYACICAVVLTKSQVHMLHIRHILHTMHVAFFVLSSTYAIFVQPGWSNANQPSLMRVKRSLNDSQVLYDSLCHPNHLGSQVGKNSGSAVPVGETGTTLFHAQGREYLPWGFL